MEVLLLFLFNILFITYFLPKFLKYLFIVLPVTIQKIFEDDPEYWSDRRKKLERQRVQRQYEISREKSRIMEEQKKQEEENERLRKREEELSKIDRNFIASFDFIMNNLNNKEELTIYSDMVFGNYRRIECKINNKGCYCVLCYNTSNKEDHTIFQTFKLFESNSYLIKLDQILNDREKIYWFNYVQKINRGEIPVKNLELVPYHLQALKKFYKPDPVIIHEVDELLNNNYIRNIETVNRMNNYGLNNIEQDTDDQNWETL